MIEDNVDVQRCTMPDDLDEVEVDNFEEAATT